MQNKIETAHPSFKDSARELWFKRYPVTQTLAAFALAVFATCAISMDPLNVSGGDVIKVDPAATGAYFTFLKVFLSFTGNYGALASLSLACLLTFPFRYVFFGRRDSRRPSVIIPALILAFCFVVGRSYDVTDGAAAILADAACVIAAFIQFAGWYVLGHVGIYLFYEVLDWLGSHKLEFSETRFGRAWQAADFVLNKHPFLAPFLVLVIAWLPTLLGSAPGLFMGDTGAQIRQWFGLRNGPSTYLKLIDPHEFLNAHHPVLHTAFLGTCVEAGLALFGSANMGLLIYTLIQYTVTALSMAYLLSTLRRFGAGLVARLCILAFFVFMPMFSNYAVLITKDVLFADFLLVMMMQVAKLLLPRFIKGNAGEARGTKGSEDVEPATEVGKLEAGESMDEPGLTLSEAADVAVDAADDSAAGPATAFRSLPAIEIPFTRFDWVLLVVSALGTSFFRNGGFVLPAVALVLVSIALAVDRRRAARPGSHVLAPSRLLVAAPIVVACIALGSYLWFSNVFMPEHGISPGSRREVLSIPFQMTARFVQKHDGAHSGVKNGTDDGLVTKEEREVIDRVLNYSTLGKRYDPNKSDDVKSGFNEYASKANLDAYFEVWVEMFWKDPECYVSALVNNYYGYFYPSEQDVWTYSPATSRRIMARKSNQVKPFDFAPFGSPVNSFCGQLVNVYRVAIQRIPLLSLTMSSATYVWLMALSSIYLLRGRQWRALALWVTFWSILAVCLIGPCNGATYMRYIYPVVLIAPFVAAVTLTWPRPFRSRRA